MTRPAGPGDVQAAAERVRAYLDALETLWNHELAKDAAGYGVPGGPHLPTDLRALLAVVEGGTWETGSLIPAGRARRWVGPWRAKS